MIVLIWTSHQIIKCLLQLKCKQNPNSSKSILEKRISVLTDRVMSVSFNVPNTNREGRKEMFYLTTHSTHFNYGYMASDIWLRTILIVRKESRFCHIGYSFRLTARVLFICTDRIAHITACVTPVVEHRLEREIAQWVHPMKDRSDDPSHHERTFLPQSYVSLHLAPK